MAEKKEVKVEEPVKNKAKKVKKELTYAEKLEARAQRGQMTHQKQMAIKRAKEKEIKKGE